jgi:cytochrome c oxidase cbb3-type subunit III
MRRGHVVVLLAAALVLPGCEREKRRYNEDPAAAARHADVRLSQLQPGGPVPATPRPKAPYEGNAWATSEGQRLFSWFNCVGCHANGGGGMGPPLMDDYWIYGSEPQNVYRTIVEGRPRGMPAFGARLSGEQVWQLVAYVRSLSGLQPMDVVSARSDHMQIHEDREK